MSACEQVRPLLFRVAEGEATPPEAMRVARHTPTCTACRILLARESRLAQLLESDLDDLPVEEAFVETVMSTLPDRPPAQRPARGRAKGRRGLKLAVLAGAALSTLAMGRGLMLPGSRPDLAVPHPTADWLDGAAGSLLGLLKAAWLAADALTARIPIPVPALSRGPELAIALATALALGLVLSAMLAAVAAGWWVRSRDRSVSA